MRSDHDVRSVEVTINGRTIYSTSWASGVSEATWATTWTPPKFGLYSLEATLTNGQLAIRVLRGEPQTLTIQPSGA